MADGSSPQPAGAQRELDHVAARTTTGTSTSGKVQTPTAMDNETAAIPMMTTTASSMQKTNARSITCPSARTTATKPILLSSARSRLRGRHPFQTASWAATASSRPCPSSGRILRPKSPTFQRSPKSRRARRSPSGRKISATRRSVPRLRGPAHGRHASALRTTPSLRPKAALARALPRALRLRSVVPHRSR